MKAFISKHLTSFTYLNCTQFTGALIDNIYKLLVVYFLIQQEGIENSHTFLSVTGAIFVIPFLLFSTTSGTLADRYSKRDIIVLTKIFELIIMGGAVLSFFYESKWGAYVTLFLLATQSAFFAPSKYGIIPELVNSDKITKANGLMTSFTFLAIILGTFLASFFTEVTSRNFILCTIIVTFISLLGVITSFGIEHTPPSGAHPRFNLQIFATLKHSLQTARQEPLLLAAILGSAFFLFVGAFIQLNVIPFAVHSLNLSDVQGGYLFLMTSLGIGTGSMLAGRISGKIVELALVPIGALGITISLFMLDFFSSYLIAVVPLVIILGMCGGIYMIPLDSYIQVTSPNTSRGQVVAATNFLSFFGVLCASAFLYLISAIFELKADQGFTIMGFLTLGATFIWTVKLFDYITRFLAMLLSRFHFRTLLIGKENIPDVPALYICTHTAWNDTLLMLGSQRRRLRFFIEREQHHSWFLKKLYRLLRVVQIPTIERLERSKHCMQKIQKCLRNGISVCIFINHTNLEQEIYNLKNSDLYHHGLHEIPIVPVVIDKAVVSRPILMNKIRIPASVTIGASF